MSADLVAREPDGAVALLDGAGYPDRGARVVTASGKTISGRTAWRVANSVPRGTRAARRSRVHLFTRWCRDHGRIATDGGTVPDYLTHLADLHHPAATLVAHLGTLAAWLSMTGQGLDDEDRRLCRAVVDQRSATEAADGSEAPGPLQATEATVEDLAAMVGTCHRSTPRGARDAYTMLLDWFMAGRCSEPAALNRLDVAEVTARYRDPETGRPVVRPALEITVRTSKTNPYGRHTQRVRIVGQDDPQLCPVLAHRAWTALLDAQQVPPGGPLLRRIDRWGRIGGTAPVAGRPPADPARAYGIGDRTVRNIIATAAERAGLVRAWGPAERELLSTAAERAALAGVADPYRREELRADLRKRRRALRRSRPRYTGHSMRRGCLRAMQRRGRPRHIIEQHGRYRPGSRSLGRYLDDVPPWESNGTVALI
ncbi:hypothetical protein ACWCXH_33900 [Kitasatospora sp. NPDC001660]